MKTYHCIIEALLPLKFGAMSTWTLFLSFPSFGGCGGFFLGGGEGAWIRVEWRRGRRAS